MKTEYNYVQLLKNVYCVNTGYTGQNADVTQTY